VSAQRVVAVDLRPGDALLHAGNWFTVTGLVHYPDAGVVNVRVKRLIGGPTTITLHDVETPWVIPAGEPVPEI
jgi:flagella basal body P-ring formation protein FlgA